MKTKNSRFINVLLIVCYTLSVSCTTESSIPFSFSVLDYSNKKFTVLQIKLFRKKNYISFVVDEKQDAFIIKQNNKPRLTFRFIGEVLGAYIANANEIAANHVTIIPAGVALSGKVRVEQPATLHTVVPGQQVKSNSPFYIRQRKGLTDSIIHAMSLHSDLPAIVALDTFIGNRDRNHVNLFYDEESNKFWLIDFGDLFSKRILSSLASNCINTMLENRELKLTMQELNGLIMYRDTLIKLVKKYPPHTLHEKIDHLVIQAGIKPSIVLSKGVTRRIQLYKNNIAQNYEDTKELIIVLDKLIDRYKNKKIAYNNSQRFDFISMKQEVCIFNACQNEILWDVDLDCSDDQLDYIADRFRAYNHVFEFQKK